MPPLRFLFLTANPKTPLLLAFAYSGASVVNCTHPLVPAAAARPRSWPLSRATLHRCHQTACDCAIWVPPAQVTAARSAMVRRCNGTAFRGVSGQMTSRLPPQACCRICLPRCNTAKILHLQMQATIFFFASQTTRRTGVWHPPRSNMVQQRHAHVHYERSPMLMDDVRIAPKPAFPYYESQLEAVADCAGSEQTHPAASTFHSTTGSPSGVMDAKAGRALAVQLAALNACRTCISAVNTVDCSVPRAVYDM